MNKVKLLFVLAVIIAAQTRVQAQQSSIVPDISVMYLDKLIQIAKTNYPAVRANEAKIVSARAAIGKAGVSYLDAFTVSYIYQPQTSTVINGQTVSSQFNGFQAGVFFNLGTFLEKPFAVRQAKQDLEVAQDTRDEYMLTLTNNVKKRYYTYVQFVAFLKLQTQAATEAENVANDVKHRFQKGEETYANYSKAQFDVTTAYSAKIQAETNALIAKADLEELLGEKLEDIK